MTINCKKSCGFSCVADRKIAEGEAESPPDAEAPILLPPPDINSTEITTTASNAKESKKGGKTSDKYSKTGDVSRSGKTKHNGKNTGAMKAMSVPVSPHTRVEAASAVAAGIVAIVGVAVVAVRSFRGRAMAGMSDEATPLAKTSITLTQV